jgi:predicted RNA methylase
MRETFGGSDAAGAWSWRMAYDAMQAAAVMQVVQGTGQDALSSAGLLASRLLTETRRSEQQIRLQQFSTPLSYAALVARAAAIRSGETFLEPSAGTGALAGFALRAGGKPMLNEIDPFRRALLEAVFAVEVTGHDAEHIDDLLATPDLPGVIVMNPPFVSSVDRSRDRHVAAKHLIAAAKRLAPGGRLVAIMPTGLSPERDAAHWARASAIAKPRLALTIPGHVYRKLGTTVETQLIVFDKVQDEVAFVRAVAADLEAAQHIVDDIAATRSDAPLQSRAQVRAMPRQGSTPAVRSRRVVASSTSKLKAQAAVPLAFTALDTPRENTPVSDIYARYRPQRIEIAGAQEHPTPLVESIAMASVAPPAPSSDAAADLRLPGRLIEEGHLSEAQLETILMANDAHERDLPGRFTIDEDQTRMMRADDDRQARAYRLGYQGPGMRRAHPGQLASRSAQGGLGLQIRHAHRGCDPRLDRSRRLARGYPAALEMEARPADRHGRRHPLRHLCDAAIGGQMWDDAPRPDPRLDGRGVRRCAGLRRGTCHAERRRV